MSDQPWPGKQGGEGRLLALKGFSIELEKLEASGCLRRFYCGTKPTEYTPRVFME